MQPRNPELSCECLETPEAGFFSSGGVRSLDRRSIGLRMALLQMRVCSLLHPASHPELSCIMYCQAGQH